MKNGLDFLIFHLLLYLLSDQICFTYVVTPVCREDNPEKCWFFFLFCNYEFLKMVLFSKWATYISTCKCDTSNPSAQSPVALNYFC